MSAIGCLFEVRKNGYVPGKSMVPLLSASTSLIMSCNSDSEGFCPRERMTVPSSLVVICPTVICMLVCAETETVELVLVAERVEPQSCTNATRPEMGVVTLHTITVFVLTSARTSQQSTPYPYFGPARYQATVVGLSCKQNRIGGTERTKREKASLNSDTCSSVRESAYVLSACSTT